MQSVAIGWQFIIGIDDGDGLRLHFCNKALAVLNEDLRV
jgi:hypothetical protein